MPWFDPPELSVAEESAFIQPGGSGIPHKVGRWPHPNVARTDSRFILREMDPLSHIAYRRLFCVECNGTTDPVTFPDWRLFGHQDLEVVTEDHLQQSVPANVNGWDLTTDITSFSSLPVAGEPGIEFKLTLTHAASGHQDVTTYEFERDTFPFQWNTIGANLPMPIASETKTPAFPFPFVKMFDWPMSDCFLFERDFVPEAGFARFDGIDSYIKNRSRTNDTTGAWRQEFDIRLHSTGQHHYLCKSFNTTRFNVIRPENISYINRVVVFSTPLNQDQWYHIDFRYQWVTADGLYRVSVDGGADDTAANTNFNARWDQYGKRAGQAPVGEFDLRNFKLTNGPESSPVVYLDQKFDVNACDDGPDGRDGDTFFMSLPSCP